MDAPAGHFPPMRETLGSTVRWPRVRTTSQAVAFIRAVGCCLLFPVRRLPLPSLYWAVARRQIQLGPEWDAACEKIWTWKDELPRRRRAWYGKYFRGRGTFIAPELLPHFLALQPPRFVLQDPERLYAEGVLSAAAAVIWTTLQREGPLATVALRHACAMISPENNLRFQRALLELQTKLVITHFGAEQETAAWPSSRFELTARAFPGAVAAAERLSPAEARAAIVRRYLSWCPRAAPVELARLFGWSREETLAAWPEAIGRGPARMGAARSRANRGCD
ncbi:MAG: hypothetical protein K6U09_05295 [Acidobacteriia bacterium]|jgi:hypothetical protein|nr:hypothetical protein [Terriglobia bacterium]